MDFKYLIKFLIDPFTIFWILLFITLVALSLKKKQWVYFLIPTMGLWFLIISTPFFPTLLLNSLEDRYEPVNIYDLPRKEGEFYIVVLGGGHGFDNRLPANSLLSREALGRLSEGIRIYQQLPKSKLVLSGFSASGRTTQAEMLQQTALLLGVKKKATILQKGPRNTLEEAETYAKVQGPNYQVILVTSAYHMPRAVRLFSYWGIKVIPSPTNYYLMGTHKVQFLGWPSIDNIKMMSIAITEYAGLMWYGLTLD